MPEPRVCFFSEARAEILSGQLPDIDLFGSSSPRYVATPQQHAPMPQQAPLPQRAPMPQQAPLPEHALTPQRVPAPQCDPPPVDWEYGYDDEHGIAWRRGKGWRHPEFARKLCAGKNDFDNVHALFRDGSTYAIPELLTVDLKARLQGERPARLPKAPTQAQKKKDRQREGLEGTVQAG